MGARFALSVANLFMTHWVFRDHPPHLACYRRYIAVLLMIWEKDMSSLELFMKLNRNTKNIKLTLTIDVQHQ